MAFDPDAYLAELAKRGVTTPPDEFDPDAYLAELGARRPTELLGRQTPQERTAEPDEPPAKRAAPGEPSTPEGVPALVDPEAPGALETAVEHGAQGLSGGFYDEANGLVGRPSMLGSGAGLGFPMPAGAFGAEIPAAAKTAAEGGGPRTIDEYRKTRDETRQRLGDEAAANPKTALAAEVAGAAASPLNKLGPGAGAGAGAGRKILAAGARGAIQGAIAGAGNSDADLTKLDQAAAARFARDVLTGGAVGGAIGAGGEAAVLGAKTAAKAVLGDARRGILNMVAEGMATTTPTGRKRLEKSADAIVDEVINGPDGKAVVNAVRDGDAIRGREMLKPILNRVGEENAAAYRSFEDAGRAAVPVEEYLGRLEAEARAASSSGKTELARGLRAVAADARGMAEENGGLTLQQVRGFTTQVQGRMSSVLGSLNEHQNAKVSLQVLSAASRAMDDTLEAAAGHDPALQEAANVIRANNQRFNALKTIDDSLRLRSYKEATRPGPLTRAAKALTAPTGGAAAGALLGAATGDEDERAKHALMGAAAGAALVTAAKHGDRALTSAAIRAAQGKAAVPLTGWIPPGELERLYRALGVAGTRRVLQGDEEKP